MTTVVALARKDTVLMAADTLVNVYDRPVLGGVGKVLRFPAGRDEVLLGLSGLAALPGLLAAKLVIEAAPDNPADGQPWATAVAIAISEIAVEAHLVEDGKMEAHLILGWRGRLWTLSHMLAVPHPDGIAAIGSGEQTAVGALDAYLSVDPLGLNRPYAEMVARACAIAINRDRYSGGPVEIHLLESAPADAVAAA